MNTVLQVECFPDHDEVSDLLSLGKGCNAQGTYTGLSAPGINICGSFDRAIFLDHDRVYRKHEIMELAELLHDEFRKTAKSRYVIRVLSLLPATEFTAMHGLHDMEISSYPDYLGRFHYLSIGFNTHTRRLPRDITTALCAAVLGRVREVEETILKETGAAYERGGYAAHARQQLQSMRERRLSFTRAIGADELSVLWAPFGWDCTGCQTLLESHGEDVVLGLRDAEGELVAAALYSDQSHTDLGTGRSVRHGESTEWATHPERRHRQIVVPLLIGLHSYLLERGIQNIWADLRCPDPYSRGPHSLSPAIKAGMKLFASEELPFISVNHVTIGGTPDSFNAHLPEEFEPVSWRELRSFVKGYVRHDLLTPEVRDPYLNAIYEERL